jgi:hypothetical protein
MIRLGDYFGAFKALRIFAGNVSGDHAGRLLQYTVRTAIQEGRNVMTGQGRS